MLMESDAFTNTGQENMSIKRQIFLDLPVKGGVMNLQFVAP